MNGVRSRPRWWKRILSAALLLAAGGLPVRGAELVISEFMAINTKTLMDEDLDYSDWIEIYNAASTNISLNGWHLTDKSDNPTKWTFPATNLAAGKFLVVFASEKSRRVPGAPLHTNFKLTGDGEYLALIKPDGVTRASVFDPAFPVQYEDRSYGLSTIQSNTTVLAAGAPCRAKVPTSGTGTAWTARTGYNDSDWLAGTTGVGYDTDTTASGYLSVIGLDVKSVFYNNTNGTGSVYVRLPFVVTDADKVGSLILWLRFDDGFVAYINGTRVAASNAPSPSAWNDRPPIEIPDMAGYTPFTLASPRNYLVTGTNMLAVQGLDRNAEGGRPPVPDFLLLPKLEAVMPRIDPAGDLVYFGTPTPGAVNASPIDGVCAPPAFSRAGGTFTNTFALTLTAAEAGATIRYTLDRTLPSESSTAYAGPLTISGTTMVRARVYAPGKAGGPAVSHTYVQLAADVRGFNSNLPLLIIDSFGFNIDAESNPDILYPKRPVFTVFIETNGLTRTPITGAPQVTTRGGMIVRGSSTSGEPKHAYTFWAYDEDDLLADIEPYGLPAETEWVFYAPYRWDPALIRNPLVYKLANQTGKYAARTRFCEVFYNSDGGPLTSADYRGVYVLEEKVKRDKARVDIAALNATDLTEPDITGGYIWKWDRLDPGETGFKTTRNIPSGSWNAMVYPSEAELKAVPAQWSWFTNHLQQVENAFYAANFVNPATGLHVTNYVDVSDWVDYHIIEMLTKNPDALRLSSYFYKDRGGRLKAGPAWDYDRTMESYDGRDDSYNTWDPSGGSGGYFFASDWWSQFFRSYESWQCYIDHWQNLRAGPLSFTNVAAVIADMSGEVEEASVREFQKWTAFPPRAGGGGLDGTWRGEIAHLQWWLTNRLAWVDSQFIARPVCSRAGGPIAPGFALTLTAPAGTTIYYTLNGADPRAPGGAVAASALRYTAGQPIVLTRNTLVRARATDGTTFSSAPADAPWSGLTEALYSVGTPPLAITELMYHPRAATGSETNGGLTAADYEYVELRNTGAGAVGLAGVRLTDGVDFDFSYGALPTLGAGETVLIVDNLAAFKRRYTNWAALRIAGEFGGDLADAGERIVLTGPTNEVLADFTYGSGRGWPAAADGAGHALEPLLLAAQADGRLDYGGWWTASAYRDGSPGQTNPPAVRDVVFNEFGAHTDYPAPWLSNDWLELLNTRGAPVALDGWYLSDDADDLRKWAIPATNTLAAYGRRVFDEVTGFHNPLTSGFGLDKKGEALYLTQFPAAGRARVADAVRFKAQLNGPSEGRYPDGSPWWLRLPATRGAANAAPAARVIIEELQFHPAPTAAHPEDNTDDEFIELRNAAAAPVSLMGETGAWRLDGAVTYTFPTGIVLAAGERILVLPFDPADAVARAAFEAVYGAWPSAVRPFGPYAGRLSNRGERVALEQPLAPDLPGEPISWAIVDEAIYFDREPWPAEADGTGYSLQRTGGEGAGNNPTNWLCLAASPGRSTAKLLLTTPVSGTVGVAPYATTVETLIQDAEIQGGIQRVDLLVNGAVAATVTQPPYALPLGPLSVPGVYTLAGVLVDGAGSYTSRSATVQVVALQAAGVSNLTDVGADVWGRLSGPAAVAVTLYWGPTDGGTNAEAWSYTAACGVVSNQAFAVALAGLTPGTPYFHRWYAQAAPGGGWAPATENFRALTTTDWAHRLRIVVRGYSGAAPLTNFPALVRLGPQLDGFAYSQFQSPADAADLRFMDAAQTTVLSHELGIWDTNGVSAVWVRVPRLAGTNTTLWAFWGAPGPVVAAPSSLDGSTWSAGYAAVWHFDSGLTDATAARRVAVNVGTTAAAGVLGSARLGNGSSAYLTLPLNAAWYTANLPALTVTAWARASIAHNGTILGAQNAGVATNRFSLEGQSQRNTLTWLTYAHDVKPATRVGSVSAWQMLALVTSGGNLAGYVDGIRMDYGGAHSAFTVGADPALLCLNAGAAKSGFFNGALDEVRIAAVARSADWILAEYLTLAQPDDFVSANVEADTVPDADGDGLPDAWEVAYFGATNAVAGAPGDDRDGDGASNGAEYLAGTNPTNAQSRFTVRAETASGGSVRVGFETVPVTGDVYSGRVRWYDLLHSSVLTNQPWQGVPGFTNLPATGTPVWHTNETATGWRYYRGRVRLE